jgi:hypothetical protein
MTFLQVFEVIVPGSGSLVRYAGLPTTTATSIHKLAMIATHVKLRMRCGKGTPALPGYLVVPNP